jgi:hypothetical protein
LQVLRDCLTSSDGALEVFSNEQELAGESYQRRKGARNDHLVCADRTLYGDTSCRKGISLYLDHKDGFHQTGKANSTNKAVGGLVIRWMNWDLSPHVKGFGCFRYLAFAIHTMFLT